MTTLDLSTAGGMLAALAPELLLSAWALGLTVYPFTSQAAPGAVSIGRTQVIQPTH